MSEVLRIGAWEVLPDEYSIRKGNFVHKFQSKVFHVLMVLAESQGATVTRDHLIEVVWENNVNVGQKGITRSIWQLRKALQGQESDEEAIRTLSKLGYQLTNTTGLSSLKIVSPVLDSAKQLHLLT